MITLRKTKVLVSQQEYSSKTTLNPYNKAKNFEALSFLKSGIHSEHFLFFLSLPVPKHLTTVTWKPRQQPNLKKAIKHLQKPSYVNFKHKSRVPVLYFLNCYFMFLTSGATLCKSVSEQTHYHPKYHPKILRCAAEYSSGVACNY